MHPAHGEVTAQPANEEPAFAGPVDFPHGLPGFPAARRFELHPLEGAPGFAELRSLEDPSLRLPLAALPAGAMAPAPAELASVCGLVGLRAEGLRVYYVVTLAPGDPPRAWINLRAPVLVDPGARRGVQVVLADPRYPLRCPLPPRPTLPTGP